MRLRLTSLLLLCAVLMAGCSGGGSNNSGGGGGNPPPTAPTVTSTSPAGNATGVAINTTVTATFSAAMNSSTLSASSFTLTGSGGTAVSGTVTYDSSSNTAKFTPGAALAFNTKYTATITTAAANTSGTVLASAYTWTFTTVAAPAPTVSSTDPANAATGVVVTTTVKATFSLAMQASSISASTFTLATGATAVTGTVSYDTGTSTATFTPSAALAAGTVYTATITTGALSTNGAALAANYTWSFTTEAASTPPTVTTTIPANAATGVSVTSAMTASFSEAMNASTINAGTFTVTPAGGSAVSGTVSYSSSGSVATFTPGAPLAYSTAYTAKITTAATGTNGVAMAADYTWTFTTAAVQNLATVDFSATKQTIRGFGASTAWMGALPSAKINALFGTGANQIGLSILRVRIDPYGSAGSNWVTANWGQELTNAQGAIAANPNALIMASPWTPPASMKTNNNTTMGSLDPTHYADYATYLEDYVTYFKNAGVNLYGISMQNEPDANVTYESCTWTPQQMDTWVANNSSVLTTKLIMPESQNFLFSYSDPTLNDPNAVNHVGIVAGHIYGVSPAYYANAVNKGKDVWQTEHYLSPAAGSSAQPAIGDALKAAKEIHDSMVTAQYNAYLWWWAIDWNPGTGNTNDGLLDTSGNVNYYGYALAQYARFIQPGSVRVNATDNPQSNVYVSAYSANGHQVIVAINMSSAAVSQAFSIQNASVTSLTPYQTTASGGVAQQTAVSVSGGAFTYNLPAQSITTFVQ